VLAGARFANGAQLAGAGRATRTFVSRIDGGVVPCARDEIAVSARGRPQCDAEGWAGLRRGA
jgi:hypothetical protein